MGRMHFRHSARLVCSGVASLSLLLGCSTAVLAADAQPNGLQALTPEELEQERLRARLANIPPPYVDKVMVEGDAIFVGEDSAQERVEPEGLRSSLVETRVGYFSADNGLAADQSATEVGLRAEYRQQTLNYGDFSLHADLRGQQGDEAAAGMDALGYARESSSGRLTLRNIGLPLTPGIQADTALGDTYSDLTPALTRHSRLWLGSSIVRGATTRIYSQDYDLRLGSGARGYLAGGPYPGFERAGGQLSWLGYTHRMPGGYTLGIQANQASDVQAYGYASTAGGLLEDIQSLAASVGYGKEPHKDGDLSARLTLLHSSTRSDDPYREGSAGGAYLETNFLRGRWRHDLGAYSAEPNLRFGDHLVYADKAGAFWRMNHSVARLNWGLSLDYARNDADPAHDLPEDSRYGLGAHAHYRIDYNSSAGGHLNTWQLDRRSALYSEVDDGTRSYTGSVYYQRRFYDWGNSRFSLNAYRNERLVLNDVAATGEEFQWEHDWVTGKYETMRPEFTTLLGYAIDRSETDEQRYPTAGLRLRRWINPSWHIGGHLRYTSREGHLSTTQGLAGALISEYELGRGWRTGIAIYMNQLYIRTDPGPAHEPLAVRTEDQSVYLYLRWENRGGRPFRMAGASTGRGGGMISGLVFLDENGDGERQGHEIGAPNVEVVLDGRYPVLTDREGRFTIPAASTGAHSLDVRLESVPLPWGGGVHTRQSVDVPLRGEAQAFIPLVRMP